VRQSRQQPEHEATAAVPRVLEEEERSAWHRHRLPQATRPAGSIACTPRVRGQVPVPRRRRQPHPLLANWASAQATTRFWHPTGCLLYDWYHP
jgi:hypothetical protein